MLENSKAIVLLRAHTAGDVLCTFVEPGKMVLLISVTIAEPCSWLSGDKNRWKDAKYHLCLDLSLKPFMSGV